jgi:hypothetical protein
MSNSQSIEDVANECAFKALQNNNPNMLKLIGRMKEQWYEKN